jgi:ketosteroid isomerase-like protein
MYFKGKPMLNIVIVLFLPLFVLAGEETRSRADALSDLVQTERSFARTCGEKGIRASFLEYFADDAIAFFPQPVKYKAAVKDLPAPDPHLVTLEWEPQAGGMSASCDMGYTTGPSVRTDNSAPDRPHRYGMFFSVWRKQTDGFWKVAVDIGVSTPAQVAPFGVAFKEPESKPYVVRTGKVASTNMHATIMNLDAEFSKACSSLGVINAYLLHVDNESRLYRTNSLPIIGVDSIRSYLNKRIAAPAWTPVAAEMSLAGDLGYSYGSYEYTSHSKDQSSVEKGYYLHVWKRTATDEWRIVADITNPSESENRK